MEKIKADVSYNQEDNDYWVEIRWPLGKENWKDFTLFTPIFSTESEARAAAEDFMVRNHLEEEK